MAVANGPYLVLYIRGFISPFEEVLLRKGQSPEVDFTRRTIIKDVLEELKGMVQFSLNEEVVETYHDWNFPSNSGSIILKLDQEITNQNFHTDWNTDLLETEVNRISEFVQKVPDELYIYPVSDKFIILTRIGILIRLEKALISKGFEKELVYTKDELEKSYFHNDVRFQDIFKHSIKDIFIDWNMKEDKSVMCIILK